MKVLVLVVAEGLDHVVQNGQSYFEIFFPSMPIRRGRIEDVFAALENGG